MKGWKTDKLMNLVSSITTGKLDANAMVSNGQYRFYTCAKEYYFIDKYAFDDEALLISGNGEYVGYIHYYKGKFNAYQRVYVLTGFKIDVKYLQNYLNRYLPIRINKEVSQNNIPYIRLSTLSKMDIKYPESKLEQTAIANILSKVDEAIAAVQSSIAAAERLKKSLLQNLLTGRMKLDGTLRNDDEFYMDEKFGKVPKRWEVKKVKDLFYMNQNTLSNKTDADYKFRYIIIETVSTESIDYESCPEYSFKDSPGRARRIIKDNDILISGVRPNLKAFAIYTKPDNNEWICSTGFHVLTAKDEVCPQFFFYQILSHIGASQFHSWVAGSNYPAIGDSDMRKMQLYVPPYDEQVIINQRIECVSRIQQDKQTKIATLERLSSKYRKRLHASVGRCSLLMQSMMFEAGDSLIRSSWPNRYSSQVQCGLPGRQHCYWPYRRHL